MIFKLNLRHINVTLTSRKKNVLKLAPGGQFEGSLVVHATEKTPFVTILSQFCHSGESHFGSNFIQIPKKPDSENRAETVARAQF